MKKVIVITGASRGIGAATARLAAARGYAVCVNYLKNQAAAKAVVDEIKSAGGQTIAVGADVASETGVVNLFKTVDAMRAGGVKLLDTIDTYYELVDKRIPGHGEDVRELKKRKILVDGKAGALLLQIFTENQLGPIFFEFIQRKGDEGFGEGNFKALFESIELDQIRRGVLKG